MLVPEQRTLIGDFVRKHASARPGPNGTAETPDVYFKAKHGQSVNKAVGVLAPVYASAADDVSTLALLVCDHVTESYVGADEPAVMWLTVYAVGDKSPHSFLSLKFSEGRTEMDGAVEQLRTAAQIAPGSDKMANANAIVAIENGRLFRDMLRDAQNHNLGLQRQLAEYHEELIMARAQLKIAEIVVQNNGEAAARARVDALVERGGPYLDKWVPSFLAAMSGLGMAYMAGSSAPTSSTPPVDLDQAADWHIQTAVQAVVQMGLHFQAHPDTLTDPRKQKLERMVAQFMEFAAAMSPE